MWPVQSNFFPLCMGRFCANVNNSRNWVLFFFIVTELNSAVDLHVHAIDLEVELQCQVQCLWHRGVKLFSIGGRSRSR